MFPQTTFAMAEFIPLFEAYQKQPDRPLKDRVKAARAAVVLAYGRELLPAILSGRWQITQSAVRGPRELRFYGRPIYSDYYELLDHEIHFRRAGTTGMATWDNSVIVGRPYNVFKDGNPLGEAVRYAKHLAATHHVDVWARDDLSAWFPGSTSLVIAGRELSLSEKDAARFGFIHLSVQ